MIPQAPCSSAVIGFALLLVAPHFVQGQALSRAPRLDEVVAMARSANPDVVLARLREDSARGEQRIARALPPISVTASPQNPYQYSATAPLDVGPPRTYRARVAGEALLAAHADAEDAQRLVVYAARQAFYDILLAQAERDISRERRDICLQLLTSDSIRLKAGDIPELNVARSELELARAKTALTRADAATHSARLTLQLLLGVTQPDTAFTVTGSLAFQSVALAIDSLGPMAIENRPDVRAARTRIAQSRALLGLAGASLFPTPAISLVYQNAVPFANGSNYAIGVSLLVPLLYQNGGERDRARAGLSAADLTLRRTEAQIENEVQTSLDGYRAARGLAERYDAGLLTKAQHALEMARYAYGAGAISLLELLDAIRAYADTRTEYNIALHDYWVSVYAIDRAVGKDVIP